MPAEPTTWRSGPTPVCATEEMVEAGRKAVRANYPWITNVEARVIAIVAWRYMSEAAPRPIENDPEVGDRADG